MSNNDKSDKKNKKKNIFTGIINLFSNQNKKKIDDDISSNSELDNKEIESVEDSNLESKPLDKLAEEIDDSENNLKTDEETSDEIEKNSKEDLVESRKKDDIDHESFKRLELVIKETEEKKRIEDENKKIKRANELRLYELKQKQILKNNENAERKRKIQGDLLKLALDEEIKKRKEIKSDKDGFSFLDKSLNSPLKSNFITGKKITLSIENGKVRTDLLVGSLLKLEPIEETKIEESVAEVKAESPVAELKAESPVEEAKIESPVES